MNRWSAHLHHEVSFWQDWLTDAKWREARDQRISRSKVFSPFYLELVNAPPGALVRVLDVGSGPISTVGSTSPTNPIELVCVDALAHEYNELLVRAGLSELARVQKVAGEHLSATFGEDAFDIVNCANALDHFEDPAAAFQEMYRVCKPGGAILLTSVENEGEREKYGGLHQWNLAPGEGAIRLWNPSMEVDLMTRLPAEATMSWEYVDHGQQGFKIFRAIIRCS